MRGQRIVRATIQLLITVQYELNCDYLYSSRKAFHFHDFLVKD